MAAPKLPKGPRRSIPTVYNGTKFRSKLEADWARAFDALGIPFEYERQGQYFGDKFYLPDFWRPASRQYFEVKGEWEPDDCYKVRALISSVEARPYTHPGRCPDIALVAGEPNGVFRGWVRRKTPTTDDFKFLTRDCVHVELMQCVRCGGWWFADPEFSWRCQCCGAYDGNRFVADSISSPLPGFPDLSHLRRTRQLGGDPSCLPPS